MKPIKVKPSEEKLKDIQEEIEFAQKLIQSRSEGAESFMVSFHVVRDGKIYHHFHYCAFPTGDWGNCMIAMASEANRALLNAQTGAAKIE